MTGNAGNPDLLRLASPVFAVDLAWDTLGTGNCWSNNVFGTSFPPVTAGLLATAAGLDQGNSEDQGRGASRGPGPVAAEATTAVGAAPAAAER